MSMKRDDVILFSQTNGNTCTRAVCINEKKNLVKKGHFILFIPLTFITYKYQSSNKKTTEMLYLLCTILFQSRHLAS